MDVPAFRTFPGANGVDVPAGQQPVQAAVPDLHADRDLFARMRAAQAAQRAPEAVHGRRADDNGLERFITATRRQNFLVPPRRHRAFPLLEFA